MTTSLQTARRTSVLPLAAVALTVVLWASAFVAIRHVGRQLSPGGLALGRLLVGSTVLGAFLVFRQRRRPSRGDWPLLLACGVLWFGVYNVALNAAERHLDAGTAAMLVNIGPVLIALMAGMFLGEGFPQRLFLGGAIAFAGVVVIGLSTSAGAHADVLGVLLCLVAAVAYSIGMVAQKPALRNLPALQVTWLACTIGAISCLPFGSALLHDLRTAQLSTIGWMVYLGAGPTAVAFTTWAYALARTNAGKLGATTYLVPPLTIVLGWLLLSETPAVWAFAGGALCITGVALGRRSAPPGSRPTVEPS